MVPGLVCWLVGGAQRELGCVQAGLNFELSALLPPATLPAAGEFGVALKGGAAQALRATGQLRQPVRRQGGV
ncbi:MAG: hypothetical protein IPH54_21710 [Rhodoferax sp.]|nr:hypothetical protein [Rhodoferax sp.]